MFKKKDGGAFELKQREEANECDMESTIPLEARMARVSDM